MNLDNNQNYDLVRRAIISFFAGGRAMTCGYDIEDFQPCMKFVKDLYYESEKRKVDAQK